VDINDSICASSDSRVKRSRRLLTAVSDQMPGPRPGRAASSLKLSTRVLRPACPLQPLRQPVWTDCPRVATPPVDPLPHRPRVATSPAGPALARLRRHNAGLHHVSKGTLSPPTGALPGCGCFARKGRWSDGGARYAPGQTPRSARARRLRARDAGGALEIREITTTFLVLKKDVKKRRTFF